MKQFVNRTAVYRYEVPSDFINAFSVGEGDLIFASRRIYEKHFSGLENGARVAFHTDYGAGEPTEMMIDKMLADFADGPYKRIIAIGGGSVIDAAKLLIFGSGYSARELFEQKAPMKKVREFIAVPTTCGSGSEVSSVAIAEFPSLGTKLGLKIDALFPDTAVLIPELLRGMPDFVFASSAIDALIHAVESMLSPNNTPYTEFFSATAIEQIVGGFAALRCENAPQRDDIMDTFLVASNYAGIAFANTGTGAVHALSYPLSGVYHVAHGEANTQFFMDILHLYERKDAGGAFARLAAIIARTLNCTPAEALDRLEALLETFLPRKPLQEYGMKEQEKEEFTDLVIATQQRLLLGSYRPMSREDILGVYERLY